MKKIKCNNKAIIFLILILIFISGIICTQKLLPSKISKPNPNSSNVISSDDTYKDIKSQIILKADDENFDTYGGTSEKISDGLYKITYENEEKAEQAYMQIQQSENVEAAINDVVEMQEAENNGSIEEDESSFKNEETSESEIYNELSEYLLTHNVKENNVTVAILDTGYLLESYTEDGEVLYTDRVINSKYNYSDSGEKETSKDDNGHGTQMAEIILENTYDNVKILPIKVLNNEGKGTIESLYKGLQTAIDENVDIINLSIATPSTNLTLLNSVIDEASSKGIIIVGAAGNNGTNSKYIFPANNDNVISVSSLTNKLKPSSFSNFGEEIDYSSIGEDLDLYNPIKKKVDTVRGTSISSAKVTAIISKLKGIDKSYEKDDICEILDEYSFKQDTFDKKYYGNGILEQGAILIEKEEQEESDYEVNNELNNVILDMNTIDNWKDLDIEIIDDILIHSTTIKNAIFWQNLSEEDKNYLKNNSNALQYEYTLKTYDMSTEELEAETIYEHYYDYLQIINLDEVSTAFEKYPNSGTKMFTAFYTKTYSNGSFDNNYTRASLVYHEFWESCAEDDWEMPNHIHGNNHGYGWSDFNNNSSIGKMNIGQGYASKTKDDGISNIGTSWYPESNKLKIAMNAYTKSSHKFAGWHAGNNTTQINNWIPGFKDGATFVWYDKICTTSNWNVQPTTGIDVRYNTLWVAYHHYTGYSGSTPAKQDFYIEKPYQNFGFDKNTGNAIWGTAGDFGAWSYPGHRLIGWAETLDKAHTATEKDSSIYAPYCGVNYSWAYNHRNYTESNPFNLYSVWVFDVALNANGGALVGSHDLTWEKTINYYQGFKIPGTEIDGYRFERPGYVLTGWNTNANGTGTSYSVGTTVNSNITLYAQWEKITDDEYVISSSKNTPISVTYNRYETDFKEASSIEMPTKNPVVKVSSSGSKTTTSYKFGGYYTSTGGSGTQIIDRYGNITASNTFFTNNRTIYAKWIPETSYGINEDITYSISYSKGSHGSGIIYPTTRDSSNTSCSLTVTGNTFTPDNGWQNKTPYYWVDEEGNTYKAGDTIRLTNDKPSIVLTAQYEKVPISAKIECYYLKVNGKESNASDYILDSTKTKTINNVYIGDIINGEDYVNSSNEITGFHFYKGTNAPNYIKTIVEDQNENVIKLFFTRNIYELKLEGDDNIDSSLLSGAGMYQYGSPFTIDASADGVLLNDYNFKGWTCNDSTYITTDIKHTFDSGMPAKSLTIKATSTLDLVKRTVTLKPNGGTIIFNGKEYTDSTPNKTITLLEKTEIPNITIGRTGYIGGLSIEPSGSDKLTAKLICTNIQTYDFTMGKEDVIIEASWSATSVKYTVNHWKQKLDGDVNKKDSDNYELYKTEEPLGIADSTIPPTYLGGIDLEGFTPIPVSDFKINADGSTVINLYYRRNIATFNYFTNGGNLATTPKLYKNNYYKAINGTGQLQQSPTSNGTYVNATTTAIYGQNDFVLLNPYSDGLDIVKTGYSISETYSYMINSPSLADSKYYLSATKKLKDMTYLLQALKKGDATINLYVLWDADTYKITLDKCTGTGGTDEIYELYEDNKVNNPDAKDNVFYPTPECKENEQITTVVPPTKDGYTFEGYYTQESGKGTQVIDKDGNIIVNNSFFEEPTTVYAKWNYVITFDSNRPSTATYTPVGSMNQVTYTYDITGTLPANKYTITGWTFDSWNTKADGSGTSFKDMDNITNLGTRPLYAQWKQNECNIIYDLNDVSKNLDPEFGLYHPDKIRFDEDTEISNPTLSGYTFKGWTITGYNPSTAKVNGIAHTSSSWNYEKGEVFRNLNPTDGAIITFKANWSVNSYTVTLDTNKSSYQITDEEMTHNPTIGRTSYTMTTDSTANNTVNTSSVIGWKFTGWYDSPEDGKGKKVFDKDGKAITGTYWSQDKEWIYPGNVTLYAHWEAITYTVRLYPNRPELALRDYEKHNPNGWSWNNTDKFYFTTFTYDKVSNIPVTSDTYTIEGWDSYGWYTAPVDGVLKGIGTKKWNLTETDEDIILLYTQWKDNIKPDFVDESSEDDDTDPDKPKPTLINGVYVWEWTNKTITIKAKATDVGSGIDRITIYETDSSFSESSRTHIKTDEGNGVESLTTTYTVPEGERYYVAEAKDRYGNLSEIKYHTRYDKVAVRLTEATINQETLANSSSASIEQDIKDGLNTTFTLSMDDTNSDVDINKNVSGLESAILEVWDKENPDIKLAYNFETLNIERTENASNNILSCDLSIAPNLYADFKDSAILTWKVIITDYAGNESIINATEDIINYSSRTFIYNETVDSNGNEIYNDTDDNTYFQVGEIGRVEVYTVGYTDNVSLDFNILGEESAIEITDGRMNEVYRLGTNTKDDMRILYSQHSEELIPDYLRLHDDANNITTHTDVTEEMLRNSVGNKYAQHYIFTIQIPPYYQLKENGTLRDDGSPLYDSEVHTYDAVVKKGTSSITPSNKLTLWDNISVSVHYRITHES